MRRRTLAGLGLLVLAGWAEGADIGVVGTKLVIQDKLVSSGKAKVTFQSKDVNVTKGSGSDAAQLSARVVLRYNGASGEFVLPAGASDGTTGWTLNAAGVAKFVNKLAPTGPTQAKTGQVKPGAAPKAGQVKLGAKGLGDVPVAIGAAPTESVYVAFEVTNGAEVNRHCAAFPAVSCVWKSIADGTGAQVTCKGAWPTPRVSLLGGRALPPPPARRSPAPAARRPPSPVATPTERNASMVFREAAKTVALAMPRPLPPITTSSRRAPVRTA